MPYRSDRSESASRWVRPLAASGLRILMYHSIADNRRDPHALHPELFAAQMESLADRGVRVVDLRTSLARLRHWRCSRDVVVTFDDCYRDFLENAAPVLRRYAFPATVFAPTGLLGGTAIWDSFDKSKRLMDWEELKEAQRLGFDVGSHTVSHARLTDCDRSTLERELRLSLDTLRSKLPEVVPVLAYPGGFFGGREMEATRKAGYVGAVGPASRFGNYPWTNPYHLRRQRGVA